VALNEEGMMSDIDLAVISGSGFYDYPELDGREKLDCDTRFGRVSMLLGGRHGCRIAFLARHGAGHELLPHMIDHRANLTALKQVGIKALVSTTVCGVLDPGIPLGRILVFSDLFFPDNRLPDGSLCTVYDRPGDPQRGHYLFARPFSQKMREQLIAAAEDPLTEAVYGHANGPRFNTSAEIRMLRGHADCVSQTAGPEAVLAGELEIPFALLGFGVDYANGVQPAPTPVEALTKNLQESRGAFLRTLDRYLEIYTEPRFEGYIYRFE
jgi:5'-methylthioadenosine phosphorylase